MCGLPNRHENEETHTYKSINHRRVVMFNPIRLVLITLISLFIFSCDEDDNPVSGSTEIDIDWILIKSFTPGNPMMYYFYTLNEDFLSSNQLSIEQYELDDGNISFVYDNENFIYDISDSYLGFSCPQGDGSEYCIDRKGFDRIIYNQDMNYIMCTCVFQNTCSGTTISTLPPFEIIDYK